MPVDLTVEIAGLRLANPVLASSGTFGYGLEFAHLVDLNRLGGIVVKGLSLEPMEGAPAPRVCETPSGMLNAIGLQNVGVRAFVAEKLPKLRAYRTAVVANVFGTTVEEYCEVLRILEDAEGLAAYELNISCPNVKKGGVQFGSDPMMAAEVVAAARRSVAKRPLWVKLSPQISDIATMARATAEAGANALTIANTYPAMCLDVSTRSSRIASPTGGLSGPAIKPITLRLVYEAYRAVRIPILGLGGIEKPDDILEYFLAGASAIQVGTAHFADPRASERLVMSLGPRCQELNIYKISEIRGQFRAGSA
jgi:dihydroorotate dehydrogenase (NAD+) catalytic subunit